MSARTRPAPQPPSAADPSRPRGTKSRRSLAKARRKERKFRLKMITTRNMVRTSSHVPGTGTPRADGTGAKPTPHRVYADYPVNMKGQAMLAQ